MHPCFPIPEYLQSEYLLSKFFPRSMHIPQIFLVKLSYQIDVVSFGLLLKSDDIQPLLQMVLCVAFSDGSINFRRPLFHPLRSFRSARVRLNPIELLNLVPRLSIDDSLEIHILR